MRVLSIAAFGLALLASPLHAQDLAGHIAAGDAARCRRNADEALTHFRAALALDSNDYNALWKTSQALVDIGKLLPDNQKATRDSLYAEGIVLAQRAEQVNPTGADGHFMVAVATGRAALTKGARERVRFANVIRDEAMRALALDPRHDGAMHVMGRWNAEIQRLPGLVKFFAKTFLGASVFNQASWANAESFYHQAIEVNGQNIYHHLELAEALNDEDKKTDAAAELRDVAQLQPGCDPGDDAYKQQAAALLQRISR